MADFVAIIEYRATKHVGVGSGINCFSLNVEIADYEINADLRHAYSGAAFFLSFYFS